ncbi:MAG: ATP-dependent sacrificial sulfur transferase LarE [Campylobacteraceae bacterium]
MHKKLEKLEDIIASKKSLIVAHSGGVDSTFLLFVANRVLGDKALGLTVSTPYIASWELEEAISVAKEIKANHRVLQLPLIDEIKTNPPLRCYTCKSALFSYLLNYAKEHGYLHVSEGSNVDDTSEFRPGRRALAELDITTPLLEAGLYKSEIRALSHEFNLSTWDKPSYACLLTRFEHNHLVNKEEFDMVGNAEGYLIKNGFRQIRVRFQDFNARVEMPSNDVKRLLDSEKLEEIITYLKNLGFKNVSLDLPKILQTR